MDFPGDRLGVGGDGGLPGEPVPDGGGGVRRLDGEAELHAAGGGVDLAIEGEFRGAAFPRGSGGIGGGGGGDGPSGAGMEAPEAEGGGQVGLASLPEGDEGEEMADAEGAGT